MDLADPRIHDTAFVAPGVMVFGDVTIGERAVLMFGVVVRAELDRVEVGTETNVQDNCVLHCDAGIPCLVGSRVTIGHAAVVHGAVVEDHCLVGIGARALNGSHMGEGSWLAAGGSEELAAVFGLVFWPFSAIAEALIEGYFTISQAMAPALLVLYATALFALAANLFARKEIKESA